MRGNRRRPRFQAPPRPCRRAPAFLFIRRDDTPETSSGHLFRKHQPGGAASGFRFHIMQSRFDAFFEPGEHVAGTGFRSKSPFPSGHARKTSFHKKPGASTRDNNAGRKTSLRKNRKSPRVRCRTRGPHVFVLRNTLLSDYARLAMLCQEDLSSSCQASATEVSLMARVSMMPLESSSLAPKESAAARSRLTPLSPEKLSTSRL